MSFALTEASCPVSPQTAQHAAEAEPKATTTPIAASCYWPWEQQQSCYCPWEQQQQQQQRKRWVDEVGAGQPERGRGAG